MYKTMYNTIISTFIILTLTACITSEENYLMNTSATIHEKIEQSQDTITFIKYKNGGQGSSTDTIYGTFDDDIASYSKKVTLNTETQESITYTYNSPGNDNIWLTDDDVISSGIEYVVEDDLLHLKVMPASSNGNLFSSVALSINTHSEKSFKVIFDDDLTVDSIVYNALDKDVDFIENYEFINDLYAKIQTYETVENGEIFCTYLEPGIDQIFLTDDDFPNRCVINTTNETGDVLSSRAYYYTYDEINVVEHLAAVTEFVYSNSGKLEAEYQKKYYDYPLNGEYVSALTGYVVTEYSEFGSLNTKEVTTIHGSAISTTNSAEHTSFSIIKHEYDMHNRLLSINEIGNGKIETNLEAILEMNFVEFKNDISKLVNESEQSRSPRYTLSYSDTEYGDEKIEVTDMIIYNFNSEHDRYSTHIKIDR